MQIGNRNAMIGTDLEIQGEIRNGGTVQVLGLVKGILAADHVVVQPGGRVVGTLRAGSAEIHGLMQGSVAVKQLLSIGSSGVVRGDVRYGQVAMAVGGELSAEMRNIPPGIDGDFEVVVRRGKAITITSADISASDPDDTPADLVFTVARPAGGRLAKAGTIDSAIERFSQAELMAGTVLFVHDGSAGGQASFEVVVADKSGATSGAPQVVRVTVV